jgi:hypothetical protein
MVRISWINLFLALQYRKTMFVRVRKVILTWKDSVYAEIDVCQLERYFLNKIFVLCNINVGTKLYI